ncbi:MAG: ATP-binding cassette domain-containing protein [Malacoplasma sp.]|nr:ATP-binding cassette domain-containing protein [Malacoplasma sp.]
MKKTNDKPVLNNGNSTAAASSIERASAQVAVAQKPFLNVENLDMLFKVRGWYFKALDGISFNVNEGDFFGIIGESGSGKSTTGKCLIKLHQPTGGKIEIDNNLVSNKHLSKKTKKWLRKNVQMIFQDPMASLNPTKNILQLISEPISINKSLYTKAIEKWKLLNKMSKYLYVEFLTTKNKALQEFKSNYLNLLIKKLNDVYDVFVNQNYSDLDFNSAREKIIFNMDTFVEKINETTPLIYEFSKRFEQLIDDLDSQYLSENYAEVYKNYENLLIQYKHYDNIFKYSDAGYAEKTKLDNTKKEIKEFKYNYKHNYVLQNYEYLKSWKITVNGKLKTLKQALRFSKDELEYALNLIDLYQKKIELRFAKSVVKFKHLNEDSINSISSKVKKAIQVLFAPIFDEVTKISKLFKSTSLQERSRLVLQLDTIKKISVLFYESYKTNRWSDFGYIQAQYNVLVANNKDFNIFDNESAKGFDAFYKTVSTSFKDLSDLFKLALKTNQDNFNNYNSERNKLEEQKQSHLIQLNKIKAKYSKGSNEYNDNAAKFNSCKRDFEKAKIDRNNHVKNVVMGEKSNEQKRFMQITNNNINKIYHQYCQRKRDLKHLINNQLKAIKRIAIAEMRDDAKVSFVKKAFSYLGFCSNYSILKNEIKLRWKSLVAIEFEYKNTLDEVKTNSLISEIKSIYNWIFIPKLVALTKRKSVYDALDSVGLKREHAYRYPHEFSGGQRQRIVIARALINNPKIIIADEPISALDVSIQAQIINILQDLCVKKKVTVLLIAHDLSMVNYVCNNVIIMHRGRILEKGNVDKIFKNPIHPYTRSLMRATPKLTRVHIDLAAFSEEFTYDRDWSAFNRPHFYKINSNLDHQVYGTREQLSEWVKLKYQEDE